MIRGATSTLLGCVLASASLTACGDALPPADITLVSTAAISGFDPIEASDAYAGGAQAQVYEGLYEYHYLDRPLRLIPALAEGDPEISADGLTYTFRLKEGVRFQDSECFVSTDNPDGVGREVTAHDFVWCWKRLMGVPSSSGQWIFAGKVEGLDDWATRCQDAFVARGLYDRVNEYYPYEHPELADLRVEEVSGLRALDDRTFEVRLVEPYPQLLWTLAMSFTVVYPPEAVEHFGMDFLTRPVGTGPYRVEEFWPPDRKVQFVRNPTYRECHYPTEGEPGDAEAGLLDDAGRRLPLVDRIDLLVVETSNTRWLEFAQGHLDTIKTEKDVWQEAMTDDAELRPELAARGVQVLSSPKADIAYAAFNMEDPVVGLAGGEPARKLRQAMSLAYDQQRWIEVMRNGVWSIPAKGPLPPTVAGYVDVPTPYAPRDLDRARALLVDAGFPGGRGLPEIEYDMSGTSSTSRNGAEILKSSMADIGIRIKLRGQTWDQFKAKVDAKQAQMFGMAWNMDYPDAQNFMMLFYGPYGAPGANSTNYQNDEYDELYRRMKVMLPGPERQALIERMLRILHEDAPWMYTDHRVAYAFTNPWLRNYKLIQTIEWPMKYLDVDREEKVRRLGESSVPPRAEDDS